VSKVPILAAKELCTYYGHSQVLFDVSVTVLEKGGVAILGRNGAGKTTLLKTLIGDLSPTRGTIEFGQTDITRVPTEKRTRGGIAYVPQEHGVFGRLSVRENLLVGAITVPDGERRIDEMLGIFPKLAQRLPQQAGTLSGGERKMLAISRALLGRPKLLMLDEPTEGVWVGVIEEIAERLLALGNQLSILIVEQHIELAMRVSQYCYVMDRGRVALEGPSEQVRNNPNLLRLLAP
jgi:branched-chain amino acid transport system ATP-binding protein